MLFPALMCAAFVGRSLETAGPDGSLSRTMAGAAQKLLESLDAQERSSAEIPFRSEERRNWHYTPVRRQGLAFKSMTPAQQELARALLRSGLSARGYWKATTIMSLEEILRELEHGFGPGRDPGLYYVSIFGAPSPAEPWGWRVEGHHLSLNFTLVPGEPIADTPSFFGSNPAEVRQGAKKGLRALAREEDLGRELVKSLDEAQRRAAVLSGDASSGGLVPAESRTAEIQDNRGLPVAQMTAAQREILLALLNEYAGSMAAPLAEARLERLQAAGLDRVVFAWKGGLEPGMPHYYRVQGPTFLIEFDNTQNDGNHIHSVWRDFQGDWGEDLLAEHYKTAPAGHGHSHP